MTTTTKSITAEELLAMGDIGRCELLKGEIHHMPPAGAEHGSVALELAYRIKIHVEAHKFGEVFAAETGFIIARGPDTVRAPDVGFVGGDRLPLGRVKGYFPGPPDLAVEVVSPNDTASEVATKVDEWLSAGAILTWVVDPASRTIVVHRAGTQAFRYRAIDTLTDEPTLPGFTLELRSIFKS
jgi:Uma2 family endonuclease